MVTKLKIDISNGVLEVEGEENFVEKIYLDFKGQLEKKHAPAKTPSRKFNLKKSNPETKADKGKTSRGPDSHKIIGELSLNGGKDAPSLKDFFETYDAKSHYDYTLIFVYYLENFEKVAKISPDYIFTCYRHLKVKLPKRLRQSLIDTKNKKGWISFDESDEVKLSSLGLNQIEHDLEKKESKKLSEATA